MWKARCINIASISEERPNTPQQEEGRGEGGIYEKAQAWAILQPVLNRPLAGGHMDSHDAVGFINPYRRYEVEESYVANWTPVYLISIAVQWRSNNKHHKDACWVETGLRFRVVNDHSTLNSEYSSEVPYIQWRDQSNVHFR